MISLERIVSELCWQPHTFMGKWGGASPQPQAKEKWLRDTCEIWGSEKEEGGTLGQAAFPYPDKFLKFQIWTLLCGTLRRDPMEHLIDLKKGDCD